MSKKSNQPRRSFTAEFKQGSVGRGWTTGDPIIEVISHDKAKPPFEIHWIELNPTGFDVHFTLPLAQVAVPVDQVTVRQFHYLYWAEYGPDRQDNIKLSVNDVTVSEDRKTLSIKVPVVKDKVYEIDLGLLRSADDVELQNNFGFYTVNELAQ